jgi:hypothetical protein
MCETTDIYLDKIVFQNQANVIPIDKLASKSTTFCSKVAHHVSEKKPCHTLDMANLVSFQANLGGK